MGHDHGHSHSHSANKKTLTISLVIITLYMAVEVIGGLLTNSLALYHLRSDRTLPKPAGNSIKRYAHRGIHRLTR